MTTPPPGPPNPPNPPGPPNPPPRPVRPANHHTDGIWACNAGTKAGAACDQPVALQWPYPDPTPDDPDRTVPVFGCATHAPA